MSFTPVAQYTMRRVESAKSGSNSYAKNGWRSSAYVTLELEIGPLLNNVSSTQPVRSTKGAPPFGGPVNMGHHALQIDFGNGIGVMSWCSLHPHSGIFRSRGEIAQHEVFIIPQDRGMILGPPILQSPTPSGERL